MMDGDTGNSVARCLAHILMVIPLYQIYALIRLHRVPVPKVQPLDGNYWRHLAKIGHALKHILQPPVSPARPIQL